MLVDLEKLKPIVDEMFANGFEEGNRIWSDPTHPLHQAVASLLTEHLSEFQKEAAALLEKHRSLEESV